jgi:hypothetical protein
MIKVQDVKKTYYEGQETRMLCFSCNQEHATKEITAIRDNNLEAKITIPLCPKCFELMVWKASTAYQKQGEPEENGYTVIEKGADALEKEIFLAKDSQGYFIWSDRFSIRYDYGSSFDRAKKDYDNYVYKG